MGITIFENTGGLVTWGAGNNNFRMQFYGSDYDGTGTLSEAATAIVLHFPQGIPYTIEHCFIGMADGGVYHTFADTPVQVTFNGGELSAVIGSDSGAADIVSDPIAVSLDPAPAMGFIVSLKTDGANMPVAPSIPSAKFQYVNNAADLSGDISSLPGGAVPGQGGFVFFGSIESVNLVPGGTPVRATLEQLYSLLPDVYRALLDQDYDLMAHLVAAIDQIYGLRMLQILDQLFGNAPIFRAILAMHYGNYGFLRKLLAQDYGDAARYRQDLDQLYNLQGGFRVLLEQRFGIAEDAIRAGLAQGYDLSERDLLRALLEQQYVLAAGEAIVQKTDQAVHCDGVAHSSAYNIFLEQDEALFYMVGELQLADEAEYLQYHAYESEVVITVDGRQYHFLTDGYPRKSRQPGENSFIVPLASPTILLDAPHSQVEEAELVGMASQLVADLAAPYAVDWQLVDWFIPAGILAGGGDSAIALIKKICATAGGLVQTSPGGVLICRPEYPVSVDRWATASPDVSLTDQDDFFSIDPAPVPRPGYNVFFLTNQRLVADGLSMEIIQVSSSQVEIRVRVLPWCDSDRVLMHHSGGDWVQVLDQGPVTENIAEQVEIIAGSGQTTKPVSAYLSHQYSEVDLGNITVVEAGNVTTAVAENSLLQLSYQTRYWSFLATDPNIEDVQFFPEIIEL